MILSVGLLVFALAMVYTFAFGPRIDDLRSLTQVLPRKYDQLWQVEKVAAEQREKETQIAELKKRIDARGATFELFSFISMTASDLAMNERCQVELLSQRVEKNVPYKQTSVKVTLQGVSLKELTDFLSRVCAPSKLVTVDSIEITSPGSGKAGLKVEMALSALVRS
jgi:Tfp pilus assembly protein PilO